MTAPAPAGLAPALRRHDQAERPFQLSESKLRPPVVRTGMVVRTVLLDRLIGMGVPAVISVVAPAGYGKTTLLAQWAESKQPRLAWLSADRGDNDPTVLLTYLAVALDRVEPINPAVFHALASPGAGQTVVPHLVSALAAMRQPFVIVLDHAETVTNRECLDAITELALAVPAGSQFAVASRDILPLPTARLRAQGSIVEVGAHELAMGEGEAASLLSEAGIELRGDEVHDLVARTEGWPAGLYLAALAMNAGSPRTEAVFSFTGDDRYMGDYLRSEILDRVSRAEVSFLTRTSILDRLCGPLCDATLDTQGSGATLDQLDTHNLLVVPLDRHRNWYRYHQLFRQLLHAELKRREPEMIPALHSRAAAWFEANGSPERAIGHAQAAGDADRVARLVLQWMQPVWASGRVETVLGWMEWLEDKTWVEQYSAIAVHGALILALLGRPGEAERWAAAAERAASPATSPAATTRTACWPTCGPCYAVTVSPDARRRPDRLGTAQPGQPVSSHHAAHGRNLLPVGRRPGPGRPDPRPRGRCGRGCRCGAVGGAGPGRARYCCGRTHRLAGGAGLHRAGAGNRERGSLRGLLDQRPGVRRSGPHRRPRGDVAGARQYVAKAARLRPLLTYALPVVSTQALSNWGGPTSLLATPAGSGRCSARLRTSSSSARTLAFCRNRLPNCEPS